jgi:acetyl-CoA C-acetyltransferase
VLEAGYDESVPGVTLNRFCGSGLEAVNDAAALVAAGYADLVVAGGVESMSRVRWARTAARSGIPRSSLGVGSVPQGISADLLATLRGITRADVDAFALRSQQRRCARRSGAGRLRQEPHPRHRRLGLSCSTGRAPAPDTTLEGLARSRPPSR